MKKLGLTSVAIIYCALFTGNVAAQSDKVSIPIMPQPNQTTRLTLTDELNIDALIKASQKPMKLTMKSMMRLVQKSGPADDQGRFEVEITCEDWSSEETMEMDGVTLPGDEAEKKIIGKKFTTTYNREGRVLDVKDPSDLAKLIKSFGLIYDNIPKGELSIGDIAVSPVNLDAITDKTRRFENGAPAYRGDMKSKLVAVVNDAGYRIAKFDQTFEATLPSIVEATLPPKEAKSQSGAGAMSEGSKISGNGTLEINLDKRLLKAYEMKMKLGGPGSDADPISLKATINVSVLVKN